MKRWKTTFSSIATILLCTCLMSCAALIRGCAKFGDDVAKHSDDIARGADDIAKNSDVIVTHIDELSKVPTSLDNFVKNPDGTYTYKGTLYNNFNDIPFQQGSNLYVDDMLTSEQASHLISKKIKFVHNKTAYLEQRDKQYSVVFLISDDVDITRSLYDLDEENAKLLIGYASEIRSTSSIQKASSYGDMLRLEKEIIEKGEIPVVVFHNKMKVPSFMQLDNKTNIITCNSFTINPEAYLTSTDLLDMRAIIEGVNNGVDNLTLGGFYNDFTSTYYSHMEIRHQQHTLIYLGAGAAFIGSIGLTAYYSKSNT